MRWAAPRRKSLTSSSYDDFAGGSAVVHGENSVPACESARMAGRRMYCMFCVMHVSVVQPDWEKASLHTLCMTLAC